MTDVAIERGNVGNNIRSEAVGTDGERPGGRRIVCGSEIRQPFPGVQGNEEGRLNESFASADIFVVSLKKGLAGYIVPSKRYGILAAGGLYIAAVEDESEVAEVTRK